MKTTIFQSHKSSLGMDANVTVIIIYIAMAVVSWIPYLGWVAWGVPLVFFYMEKESKFVKFQSVQALIIGIIRAAISVVLQIFVWILTPKDLYSALNYAMGRGWGAWALLGTISVIIGIAITLVEVYILIKAYGWKQVELPMIGPIANKASAKLANVNFNAASTYTASTNTANTNPQGQKNCPTCGKQITSGISFCSRCGNKL